MMTSTKTAHVGMIAAVVFATLVATLPTYAQEVETDTTRPEMGRHLQGEGMEYGEGFGMKMGMRGHKGGMHFDGQFFEDLTDEQKQAMNEELEALRADHTPEDIQAMSEEERTAFHEQMREKMDAVVRNYVDQEDLDDGSYDEFLAQRPEHTPGMMKGEGKSGMHKTRGSAEGFILRLAQLDDEQQADFLETFDEKIASIIERIESSDRTDEEKERIIEKVQDLVDAIRAVLS